MSDARGRGIVVAIRLMTLRAWCRIGVTCGLCLGASPFAEAILVVGSDDPAHNTAAPEGDLAGSGWQWEGRWNGLLATAMAPGFFVTAGHVGGNVGQSFQYRGRAYVAVASYLAPEADLRVWQVAGTLPDFAPRYEGASETGLGVVLVGAGTRRGDPVEVEGRLQGWLWGVGDGVQRWGTNTVAGVADPQGLPKDGSIPAHGDLLSCTFDLSAGADEATLSSGDSGGGWFLRDGDTWKLAGVNLGVQALFRRSPDGADFFAALFDRRGLYEQLEDHSWVRNEPGDELLPTQLYAVRLSGEAAWISDVLSGAVPPESALAVESAAVVEGPYAPEAEARLDAANGRFLVPMRGESRFFRLRSSTAVDVRFVTVVDGQLELRFVP